ncbi:MAG: hypothetical protein OP8BY_1209 [Candidatus Saccharicenans subterraneus]|uniref:Uncharacterized protein n=1 Tax=Candidatus Saccharicenans subterraneus TaxID=2508984 RepID=A0A3E2BPN3_9BACT|nr:MAG: hypothetical protein OP8BY_1209 [Candidatus Saccharicenans subterraneum]
MKNIPGREGLTGFPKKASRLSSATLSSPSARGFYSNGQERMVFPGGCYFVLRM